MHLGAWVIVSMMVAVCCVGFFSRILSHLSLLRIIIPSGGTVARQSRVIKHDNVTQHQTKYHLLAPHTRGWQITSPGLLVLKGHQHAVSVSGVLSFQAVVNTPFNSLHALDVFRDMRLTHRVDGFG